MDLERADQRLGLEHLGLAQTFQRLRFRPALLQDPGELYLQLRAEKFGNGQPPQNVDRRVLLRFRAIQNGLVKRYQHALQVGGSGFSDFRSALGYRLQEWASGSGRHVHLQQRLHFAKATDVAREMQPQILHHA